MRVGTGVVRATRPGTREPASSALSIGTCTSAVASSDCVQRPAQLTITSVASSSPLRSVTPVTRPASSRLRPAHARVACAARRARRRREQRGDRLGGVHPPFAGEPVDRVDPGADHQIGLVAQRCRRGDPLWRPAAGWRRSQCCSSSDWAAGSEVQIVVPRRCSHDGRPSASSWRRHASSPSSRSSRYCARPGWLASIQAKLPRVVAAARLPAVEQGYVRAAARQLHSHMDADDSGSHDGNAHLALPAYTVEYRGASVRTGRGASGQVAPGDLTVPRGR